MLALEIPDAADTIVRMPGQWERKVREAIQRSGKSQLEISRLTGIPQSNLSSFMRGDRASFSWNGTERLFEVLGIGVTWPKYKPGRPPKPEVRRGPKPTVKPSD